MKRTRGWRLGTVTVLFLFLFFGALQMDAWARAGGGRSFGGGSYRSFSSPYSGYSSGFPRSAYPSYQIPSTSGNSPWSGGGFMRSLAGGLAGGFLGSLLFSGLGYGGGFGGPGSGGIGLLEILLFAGITLAVVSYLRRRNQEGFAGAHGGGCGSSYEDRGGAAVEEMDAETNLRRGLAEISAVVQGFDPARFPEEAMDIFFRIQGAWARRDLNIVPDLLAAEVRQELQRDLDVLKREGQINRLENITVRRADIQEAWVETGKAFVTIHFLANLLDYTVDERSGNLVTGSNEVPVKFEEYWTFVRSSGGSSWQLTAIQQAA